MRASISTCSYYKYRIRRLLEIRPPFGVEIFCEFGNDTFWNDFLNELTARGWDGPFSIHAPFTFVDIAAECNETKLFDTLRKPFDLYHRYDGEFYVVHTYGDNSLNGNEEFRRDARKRATERLARFDEICRREGVVLGAENLCSGMDPLFDQNQFLQIFKEVPSLHAVIDIGHALVVGMDVPTLQRELGERICAYHLHNNDGKHDLHSRLREGILDWNTIAEGIREYTPDATGVFEYMNVTSISEYEEDRLYLERLIEKR